MGVRGSVAWRLATAGGLALIVVGCGSGSSEGSASSPTPPSTGGTGASPITVTIANNAASPQAVTVSRGSRVTFVNNDNRPHEIDSDPHPTHTDCPEINQVGVLTSGQSHQTAILNTARACGYHDHEQADTKSLQGTITIQ